MSGKKEVRGRTSLAMCTSFVLDSFSVFFSKVSTQLIGIKVSQMAYTLCPCHHGRRHIFSVCS